MCLPSTAFSEHLPEWQEYVPVSEYFSYHKIYFLMSINLFFIQSTLFNLHCENGVNIYQFRGRIEEPILADRVRFAFLVLLFKWRISICLLFHQLGQIFGFFVK